MSNYPDGMRGRESTTIDMHCMDCGHYWVARGTWDCGSAMIDNPEDEQCPECDSWNTD